ncbi:diguanylate cyclase domain-containing protein [Terriglobus sp.]|uniref:diguanylate cyclase domain-containing protein n=1 Tax=Terriglobus sp. TaxID=1889013 RepID=UPI003B00E338
MSPAVGVMNNLLLPDLFAMAILLGVLHLVRRRYPQQEIRMWMAGLLLILLECTARLLYGARLPEFAHRSLHVIALDAYLLAGVVFLRSSLQGLQRLPRAALYAALNTAPAVLLLTAYGAGVKGAVVYTGIALAGIAIAVGSSLALRRPISFLLAAVAVWLPVAGAALARSPRLAVYLLLAGVYLLTAGTFFWTLPRRSSGKVAVVTGFVVWAACFATHPWVATAHPGSVTLASEVWNMQKFLITTGFLLVLFERQVESNEWLALHDQLTGLPNRRLFQDRIGNAIARAERDGTALILFALDLNNFKEVNDTLGHDAGDALLRNVTESLLRVVRRTDTLARTGGDEFTLLAADVKTARAPRKERRWGRTGDQKLDGFAETVPDGNGTAPSGDGNGPQYERSPVLHHALRIEQDIRAAVDKPVLVQGSASARTIEVSVSVGMAVYPADSTDASELARIADQRMYEDKRRQKGARGGLDRVLSLLTTN